MYVCLPVDGNRGRMERSSERDTERGMRKRERRKVVWKPTKKQFSNNTCKPILDNFLDKTFHCNSEGVNLAVEHLNSISNLSASLSNLKQKTEEN